MINERSFIWHFVRQYRKVTLRVIRNTKKLSYFSTSFYDAVFPTTPHHVTLARCNLRHFFCFCLLLKPRNQRSTVLTYHVRTYSQYLRSAYLLREIVVKRITFRVKITFEIWRRADNLRWDEGHSFRFTVCDFHQVSNTRTTVYVGAYWLTSPIFVRSFLFLYRPLQSSHCAWQIRRYLVTE